MDPMQVIDFLEKRIGNTAERHARGDHYDAIPFECFHAFESIRSSPRFIDALRRVRDWRLCEDAWFRDEASGVLKSLAGGLHTSLYRVLMEWANSNDIRKLKEAARLLRMFNNGSLFYDICREILCGTDDELIWGSIAAAVESTSEEGVRGRLSHFHRQRLEEISPWLQDENFRVRRFAERMRQTLQRQIEREQDLEELDRRQWS
jgi:hypothetical protein